MLIQKAFKYRLRTPPDIAMRLQRMSGCRRFVWNHGLAAIKAALGNGEKRPNYKMLCQILNPLKAENPFLYEDAVAQALQQTLKDLDRAVKDAFNPKQPLKEFPVFKKKGKSTESFRIPQGFEVDQGNSRVRLPKLGWLRYRNSRKITGTPKNVTVSQYNGHWYVSIQTEQMVPDPVHGSSSMIGIDRGINSIAVLSDGTTVKPLNAFKTAQRRLARLQRNIARKIESAKVRMGIPKNKPFPKGTKVLKLQNLIKEQKKLAKQHARIANMRRDFLHKLSTAIAKSHGLVVLENLKVANMTASAKGTADKPGKNVKQKAGLNKNILDQGWGDLARMIEYKLNWLGGIFLKVPPQYTSQKCNSCGHIHPDNRKGQKFQCLSCGYEAHADVNAACNILAAGLAVIACGEQPEVTVSMKQEPPGGAYAFAV